MTLGDRIRYFRTLRGLTQKYFGMRLGFPERTADIRVAQYEAGTRTPKKDLLETMAYGLHVSPNALKVPNIDHEFGIMHTFFALEDSIGLNVQNINGRTVLCIDTSVGEYSSSIQKMLDGWERKAQKYRSGEITKEEYDEWRYNYPGAVDARSWAKQRRSKVE